MPNNTDIFKSYDIRGAYPTDINEQTIPLLVKAYIQEFAPQKIVIGHDPLTGSCALYEVMCNAFLTEGVDIVTIGTVSTPQLYFAAASLSVHEGIMLTASHLGEGYTGIKMVRNGIPPETERVRRMKDVYAQLSDDDITSTRNASGTRLNVAIQQPYTTMILELVGTETPLASYSVVVDSGNGPNGDEISTVLSALGIKNTVINKETRASGLSHPSNPKMKENRRQLLDVVQTSSADLGIIWDEDGDRAYFLDREGMVIPPEFVGIHIAQLLHTRGTASKMTVDVRASKAVEHTLQPLGVEVKRIKAWNVPIKQEMEKDPTIGFGMETSGHYVFRDFYRIDDGLLASMLFLKALNTNPQNFHELLSAFRQTYYILEEINYHTAKSESDIVQLVKEKYSDAEITTLDGISIDYPTWRCNVRMSRTEPILRLNISGTSKTDVDNNLLDIERLIGGERTES